MKYVKLFFISVIVFGVMLFCISLLFPSTTIVSRAVNVKDSTVKDQLPALHSLAFGSRTGARQPTQPDTLLSISAFASYIQEGVATYTLSSDSTAIQVFYKIHVPTYKFWKKFGLMLNEAKYGPSLDSAIKRISATF